MIPKNAITDYYRKKLSSMEFEQGQEKYLKPQKIEFSNIQSESMTIPMTDFSWPTSEDRKELEELSNEISSKMLDKVKDQLNTPEHYDNSKGSLYKFAHDQKLNSWEFDILKRTVRCRKKGQFIEDIDKTIAVLELYKKEYKE